MNIRMIYKSPEGVVADIESGQMEASFYATKVAKDRLVSDSNKHLKFLSGRKGEWDIYNYFVEYKNGKFRVKKFAPHEGLSEEEIQKEYMISGIVTLPQAVQSTLKDHKKEERILDEEFNMTLYCLLELGLQGILLQN